jgi:hypothetical protein
MTAIPAIIGSTAATFADCDRIGTTYTVLCTVATASLVVGDTVTIPAAKFTAVSSLAVKPTNVAISTIVVTDVTKPKPTTATFTTTATGGALGTLTVNSGTGDIKHTARAGTAAAGKAGVLYKVQHLETGIVAGTQACTYTAATKTILVSADAGTGAHTAQLGAALCNNNAAYSALFVASVAAAGAMDAHADAVAAALAGGTDALTVTVNFTEELGAAAAADFVISVITCVEAVKTVAATNNGLLTGSIQITCLTPDTITSGINTVTVAATNNTTDRIGNQVDTTGTNNIVAIFAG